MYSFGEIEIVKKFLLDQCFFEVEGQRLKFENTKLKGVKLQLKEAMIGRKSYPIGGLFID